MTNRCTFLLTLLLAGSSLPASAGIHYKAVTTTEPEQGKGQEMVVEGWVEGEKARIEFQESDNPVMGEGTYLLTTDGAKTVYLVNPEEKSYAVWDIDAMMKFAGAVMEGAGGMFNMEFSEPQVEDLLAEDGGLVLGLPTRHYRYRTTYSMQMKVLGMKRASQVVNEQDIWATDALDAAALGVWLRKEPPSTGNEDLDRLVRSEMGKVEGFPLKTVTVTTTTGEKKGRQSVTRNTMEVTELQQDAPPASPATYEIPAGYQEVQLVPAGEEGEENPFAGLFGRKKDG